MKISVKYVSLILCLFTIVAVAEAQTKVGYVYKDSIFNAMPEKAELDSALKHIEQKYQDTLTDMLMELQTSVTDQRMPTAEQLRKEQAKLESLQKRISTISERAQKQLMAKRAELAKPIYDKIISTINVAAKEKGYAYIFNAPTLIFITVVPNDDLTALVKLKLGIN